MSEHDSILCGARPCCNPFSISRSSQDSGLPRTQAQGASQTAASGTRLLQPAMWDPVALATRPQPDPPFYLFIYFLHEREGEGQKEEVRKTALTGPRKTMVPQPSSQPESIRARRARVSSGAGPMLSAPAQWCPVACAISEGPVPVGRGTVHLYTCSLCLP